MMIPGAVPITTNTVTNIIKPELQV
jgi:hypothetical protein